MFNVPIKQFVCFFILLGLFVLSVMAGLSPIFMFCTFVIAITIIVCMSDMEKHFCLVFFLVTYFFFLMSSEFVQEVFHVINTRQITEEAENHTFIVLLMGIIFLLMGYQMKIACKTNGNCRFVKTAQRMAYVDSVKHASRLVFYLSFIIYLACALEQAFYVLVYSYASYYIRFSSKIPVIVEKLGDFCPIAFAIFLATYPTKKEAKGPISLYLFYALISLFTGKRYMSVAIVLLLVSYALIRNKRDRKDGTQWISKKTLVLGICILPVICVALYILAFLRSGINVDNTNSFVELLLQFFNSVGQSDKVIKYGYMYQSQIPQGHIYSFGGLIDYFKYNTITRLFTGSSITRSHTAEYAMNGNAFSYMLTYIVFPQRYQAGYGLGSCYLAELYQDAGYLGVALGSFFYGVFMRNLFSLGNKSIVSNAFVFYLYTALLRTPRDSFDLVLQEVINMKFIVFFAIIFIIAWIEYKKRSATAISGKTDYRH